MAKKIITRDGYARKIIAGIFSASGNKVYLSYKSLRDEVAEEMQKMLIYEFLHD